MGHGDSLPEESTPPAERQAFREALDQVCARGMVLLTTDGRTTVPLHEVERQAIEAAVARFGGDKSKAARALQVGRSTLYRKLRTAPWSG